MSASTRRAGGSANDLARLRGGTSSASGDERSGGAAPPLGPRFLAWARTIAAGDAALLPHLTRNRLTGLELPRLPMDN